MKTINTYILAAIVFISSFCGVVSSAFAQKWMWGRAGAGSGNDAWPVATDAAGNVFGGGISFGGSATTFGTYTVPASGGGGYQSVWVKYDPSGTPLWADGTSDGATYLNNIATDPSGNLILFGTFYSATMKIGTFTLTNAYTGGSSAQYYLAKVSPTGTVLWAIADGNIMSTYTLILGTYILSAAGVTTDASGNIYISGSYNKKSMTIGTYTLTNADPSGSTFDIFVAKYSPTGSVIWASSVGGTSDDYGFGIAVSSTGDVYTAGCFTSSSMTVGTSVITNTFSRPIAYIAKFTSAGAPSWAQSAGGANGSFAVGLARDNSGNVYMTGGFADTSITFGATTLSRKYPLASPQLALFLVQYSSSGSITWSKTIGSPAGYPGVWGYSIALASCGQVWVSGNYGDKAFIDAGDTLMKPVGPPGDPIFIAGYNLSGGVVGYAGLRSGGDDQNGIACDAAGNIFMCSDYFAPLYLGPDTLKETGSEYFYMGKYSNVVSPPDTTYATKDTTTCFSVSTIKLNAPKGYSTYFWNDGSTDTTLTITTGGKYYVYCVSCGATTLVDTFNVIIRPADTVFARIDTNVCSDVVSTTLIGPAGFTDYTWSTGSTATSIVVSTAGIYFVQAIAGCDMTVDTFHYVRIADDTSYMVKDTSVCASPNPLTLTAPPGYTKWLWNTGSTASSIPVSIASVAMSRTYRITSTKVCSTLIDTIHLVVMPVPKVSLGNDTVFCVGNTITLRSAQPPGNTYLWSTGSVDDSLNVSVSGSYSLKVTDLNGCTAADTANVTVSPFPVVDLGPDTAICTGIIPTLQSSVSYPTGTTYLWNTGSSSSSIPGSAIGTYWLRVKVGVCTSTDTMVVKNLYDTLNFQMHDTAICRGDTVAINAKGTPGMTYQWVPTAGVPLSTTVNPVIYPDTSATYVLTASISTCPDIVASFRIDVQPRPTVYIGEYKSVCQYDTLHINAWVSPKWYNSYIYSWSPASALDNTNTSAVLFTPGGNTNLKLTVSTSAGCKASDSTQIVVHPGNFASMDTIVYVCPHDSVQLIPKGGVAYSWHPGMYLNDSNSSKPWVKATAPIDYMVVAYSEFGCKDTIRAKVNVGPSAEMFLADSVTIYPGESYQISPQSNCVHFAWFPPVGLDNAYISNPVAKPEVNTKYTVMASNEWGCKIVDSINIFVSTETIYALPNAFTPGNSVNGTFKIIKRGIADLNYFRIYNRWGNMVYESSNIDAGWDGTYNGVPQPFDVYVYEIDATTTGGQRFNKHGNVTLIR